MVDILKRKYAKIFAACGGLLKKISMVTDVVAAVIRKGGRVLICKRPEGKKRALLWEFPGGKPLPGEPSSAALARECREELGVELAVGEKIAECVHEYPDIAVRLMVFEAEILAGEPKPLEHAEIRWVTADSLGEYEFCSADVPIIEKLKAGEGNG